MIREPYNITPYNSTIDTSRINEFGFNFSGDELGSWQAEVAKNNSSPEVLFTSKQYYPADAGYLLISANNPPESDGARRLFYRRSRYSS